MPWFQSHQESGCQTETRNNDKWILIFRVLWACKRNLMKFPRPYFIRINFALEGDRGKAFGFSINLIKFNLKTNLSKHAFNSPFLCCRFIRINVNHYEYLNLKGCSTFVSRRFEEKLGTCRVWRVCRFLTENLNREELLNRMSLFSLQSWDWNNWNLIVLTVFISQSVNWNSSKLFLSCVPLLVQTSSFETLTWNFNFELGKI